MLNLSPFNQETNSLILEELYRRKKCHSKEHQNREFTTNTSNVMF